MPLYEYECEKCSHRFERIMKFSDPPLEVCPSCGGTVRKLLSSPAIQFKGTGWYITDYAKKSSTDGGKNAGSSSGSGDSGAAASADKATSKSDSAGASGSSGSSGSGSSGSGSGSSS